MKKKKKLLLSLLTEFENLKDHPRDQFLSGFNSGINNCVRILEEKLKDIEKVS